MSTTQPDFEALLTRMNALEELNRKMRLFGSLAFLVLTAVLGSSLGYLALRGTVRADEFVVEDLHGKVRATLGPDGLRITGDDAVSNIRLIATGKDELLLMTDAGGKGRIYLDSSRDLKSTWLSLTAEGGAVGLRVDRDGKRVDLQDESSSPQASLTYVNRMGPALTLGDERVQDQAIMTGNGIEFWDVSRKLIWAAGRK